MPNGLGSSLDSGHLLFLLFQVDSNDLPRLLRNRLMSRLRARVVESATRLVSGFPTNLASSADNEEV